MNSNEMNWLVIQLEKTKEIEATMIINLNEVMWVYMRSQSLFFSSRGQ